MPFLHMRACQPEIDAWHAQATADGLSLSDWVRSKLNPGLNITLTPRSTKGRERSQPKPPVHTPALPITTPLPTAVNTNPKLCSRCARLGPPSRPCPSCGSSSAPCPQPQQYPYIVTQYPEKG